MELPFERAIRDCIRNSKFSVHDYVTFIAIFSQSRIFCCKRPNVNPNTKLTQTKFASNVQAVRSLSCHVFGVNLMSIKSKLLALCIGIAPISAHAITVPLAQGPSWTEFRFSIDLDGGAWLEANDNLSIISFDISVSEESYLQVTDAHRSGDQFEVFSNGSSLGLTSDTASIGEEIGGAYNRAFADDRWSSGQWLLAPGDHTVTGFIRVQPENFGRGALRVVSVSSVPVPASLPLMLGVGAVFGTLAVRRKRKIGGSAR